MIVQASKEPALSAEAKYNQGYIWTIALVAAMGGLLFGYDWVVIGGAKPFFERFFNLADATSKGWANSCALIGCLFGALAAGALSDKFGRKRLLILSAFMFAATSIGNGLAQNFTIFVVWRLLGGVAIGLASNLSPMYIAEIAPAKMRGRLVSINQLTIVIGILAAMFINYLIAEKMPKGATEEFIRSSWNCRFGWRWMFAATAVPSLLFFIGMFLVPESPRWLAKNGRSLLARGILAKIGGVAYAQQAVQEIEATLINDMQKVHFRELLAPKMRKVLFLGVGLAVLQQWCGINVIFNYAGEIFKQAGYNINDTLTNIVMTGLVNFLFTFVALFTVDRLGRKPLMLFGAAALALIYAAIGYCYHLKGGGGAVPNTLFLVLVLSAIAAYSMSLAPVTWVIISEIFPNRIRGSAMSIAVGCLWIACFLLTYTFPIFNAVLGASITFWIYAAICCVGFVGILTRLPETKGKTLEQIEKEMVD